MVTMRTQLVPVTKVTSAAETFDFSVYPEITMSSSSSNSRRQPTNATARLHTVLVKLQNNNVQSPVADVLADVFKIKDPDQNRTFLLAYTAITRMLEASQKEVETYLAGVQIYSAAFPSLRNCFSPKNSGQQWSAYKGNLNAVHVSAIQFTAERLNTFVSEVEANSEELADVLLAVQEMEAALETEDITASSREVLRDCLNEIRAAIEEYKIWGASGLDKALKSFTGTMFVEQGLRTELNENRKKGGTLWKKTEKICKGLLVLYGVLHGTRVVQHDFFPSLDHVFVLDHSTASATVGESKMPGETPELHSDKNSGKPVRGAPHTP